MQKNEYVSIFVFKITPSRYNSIDPRLGEGCLQTQTFILMIKTKRYKKYK
jgi:hypothetical protein